jgi:hypothetical protein
VQAAITWRRLVTHCVIRIDCEPDPAEDAMFSRPGRRRRSILVPVLNRGCRRLIPSFEQVTCNVPVVTPMISAISSRLFPPLYKVGDLPHSFWCKLCWSSATRLRRELNGLSKALYRLMGIHGLGAQSIRQGQRQHGAPFLSREGRKGSKSPARVASRLLLAATRARQHRGVVTSGSVPGSCRPGRFHRRRRGERARPLNNGG